MSRLLSPLLTRDAIDGLRAARARGDAAWRGSLDGEGLFIGALAKSVV